MIEETLELSPYNTNEEIENTNTLVQNEIKEENVYLKEELEMAKTALEMTSTFSFVEKSLEEEDEAYHYSNLQIFTFACYISSFCIAMVGIVFLFLQR